MVNLGKVEIKGVDLSMEVSQKIRKDYLLNIGLNHSYQRALDVTDPTAPEYNNQIAYAPRIYGSGRIGLSTPYGKLSYALLYSGHRYVTGYNIEENDLPGYSDHSLSCEKDFTIRKLNVNLKGEVLNLLNENYEIIRNFPMPGRSFRLSCRIGW
jgi:outer membrane receptor protein involved in Fe transport